jgi:hypothetical protein
MICESCNTELFRGVCPSCDLYDAAVAAQRAAAEWIARSKNPRAERAWLNQYGVFAFVDGVAAQLASAEEAAPFAALTTQARQVRVFGFGKTEGRG